MRRPGNCLAWMSALAFLALPIASAEAGYLRGVPYFDQHRNALDPSGSCQNTCMAMVLSYYGAADLTPDNISERWGTERTQTVNGWQDVFNTIAQEYGLGVRDRGVTNGRLSELRRLLDQGLPVVVHGRFSSASGHLIVLLGYDDDYYYVHDPAGGGRDAGRHVRYPREAVEGAVSDPLSSYVRFHAFEVEAGPLTARWEEAMPDSVVLGEPFVLESAVRLSRQVPGGDPPRLSADLSSLGGPSALPLAEENGTYHLETSLVPGPANGLRQVAVRVEQTVADQTCAMALTRQIVVLPAEDQPIFADGFSANWRPDYLYSATLDPQARAQVFEGRTSLAVQVDNFTVDCAAAEPAEPVGYKALRFVFHPGDATAGAKGAFTVFVNGDVRTGVRLLGNDQEDLGLALDRPEWQEVEIPLELFGAFEGPIASIRFLGNLRGTFYLDDMRLVAARKPPAPTAVLEETARPRSFALDQNFPNPFNSETMIRFVLPASEKVELVLYNLAGQRVAALVEGVRGAGAYSVHWDGRDDRGRELATGTYLCRLRSGGQVETRKMLLLR